MLLNTGCGRHIGERSVTLVAKQLTGAEVGHEQVGPTIVVDIAGRDAQPIPVGRDPALFGHIDKAQGRTSLARAGRQIVSEQSRTCQRGGRRRRHQRIGQGLIVAKHPALHHRGIQVAVIVVVEKTDPRREDLWIEEIAGGTVEVHEIEPYRGCVIDEPGGAFGGVRGLYRWATSGPVWLDVPRVRLIRPCGAARQCQCGDE